MWVESTEWNVGAAVTVGPFCWHVMRGTSGCYPGAWLLTDVHTIVPPALAGGSTAGVVVVDAVVCKTACAVLYGSR
jgi:hypothetical protein